jgi:opacity protein-like surface antigen
MSGTKGMWRGLIVSAVALLGVAALAGSQVPVKPLPKDTAAKTKPVTQAGQPQAPIKIRKEPMTAGGEVKLLPAKVDSAKPCEVVMTKTVIDPTRDDSIRAAQFKFDSVTAAFEKNQLRTNLTDQMRERVDAAKAEALAQENARKAAEDAALKRKLERGFYIGIAGGANAPQRDVRDGYTGGYNITVPVGFDWNDLPLGIRADLSVDHLNGTRLHNTLEQTLAMSGDITVWSLNTDLKLRIPAPGGTRTHFYALGGIGAHRVSGGVYGSTAPNAGQNLEFKDASTKLGWNAGAGAAIAWGPTEIFIESRFFQVKTDLSYHLNGGIGTYTAFTPFVIGVQF